MSSLVLNLASHLEAMATRNHKALPEWAVEQLGLIAASTAHEPTKLYSAEWSAAFGSISGDDTFNSPSRVKAQPRT